MSKPRRPQTVTRRPPTVTRRPQTMTRRPQTMTRRILAIEALEDRCLLAVSTPLLSVSQQDVVGAGSAAGSIESSIRVEGLRGGVDDLESGVHLDAVTAADPTGKSKPASLTRSGANGFDAANFAGSTELAGRVQRSTVVQIGKLGLRLHDFGLFENWGGLGEKWLLGHAGWYFITPGGSLYKWDASPRDNLSGDLVTQLDSRYHENPWLVFQVQDHYLDSELGLRLHESGLFEGWGGLDEKWLLGRAGWYFITPDGSLYRWDDSPQDNLTGELVAQLDARHHQHPWLLYGAQEYYLDRELGLHPDTEGLWENWGGLGEKWLLGDAGWFFVTPAGFLYSWDGSQQNNLTGNLVAQLDPRDYEHPWLLYGAQDYYLDSELGLRPDTAGRSENWGGLEEKWLLGNAGSYFITPAGSLFRWIDSPREELTGDLLAQLDPTHYQEPFRLSEASDPVKLADLRIAGTDVRMSPAFSHAIARYAIYHEASLEEVQVTAYSASDTITIDGEAVQSGEPLTISGLQAGETVSIEVFHPILGSQRSYELFYLPLGFPNLEVTALTEAASTDPVFVGLGKDNGARPYFVAILDNHGVPTFVRETPLRAGDFKLHPNGHRSYQTRSSFVNEFGRPSTDQVILDENFNEIGRFQVAGDLNHTDGHDFLILPNGNYVFLSYNGEVRDGTLFEDSVIQVVDPTTYEEVFRWNSKQDIPFEDRLREGREYVHVNSVDVDDQGNFLASLRGTSQVVKIDGETAEVIWKLGGVSSDFVIHDPLGGPCGQHTASWTAAGNLLVFDNGQLCPPLVEYAAHVGVTRAAEYRLDEANMTAELVWSYSRPDTYSRSGGSAQRLPNGNTIIGWANSDGSLLTTEVDANGNIVFEMAAATDDAAWRSYRAVRHPDPSFTL